MNTRKPDPSLIAVYHPPCATEAPLLDVQWWDIAGEFVGHCSGCMSTIAVPRWWVRKPWVVAKRGAA